MSNKRTIELIRVSTEGQAGEDRAGIPAQRHANRKTAEMYGLEIVRSFELVDVSGANVLRTPEMLEIMRLMESKDIHGVVAKEFSRLLRPENFADFALLQHFIDTQTILYLPDGPIDFASRPGRLIGGMRALMAGWERKEIRDRLNDAKESMRRSGKHPGGSKVLPFAVGYNKERGWFYTPEVEKVKAAYREVLTTNRPYAQIAAELNMPRSSLRCILGNPIYAGMRVYDKKRDQSSNGYISAEDGRQGYRKKVSRDPEEVIQVRVLDGIVTQEEFERCREILGARATRERTARSKNAPKYVYNDFLSCGVCGAKMYTHTSADCFYVCKSRGLRDRQKFPERACTNPYVLRKRIEPTIEEVLEGRLQDRSVLSGIVSELLDTPKLTHTEKFDAAAIQRQLKANEEKRARVLDTFYDGVINRLERDERLQKLDAEISTYRGLLAKAQGSARPVDLVDLETLVDAMSVFSEWSFLDRDSKRQILRCFRAEISVAGYSVRSVSLGGCNTDSRLPAAAS